TSAMLGMMQTIPESHKQLAPQWVSILTAIGFGLGPFIGGVIAQFSQAPLVTPYIPIIVGAVLCFIGLFWLKVPAFERQPFSIAPRSEEHTSELQSRENLVCRLLLEKKKE